MFHNRDDAARQLSKELKQLDLHNPLVLAIPRGGVATGAVLARELDAELDVVLSRKLRAPGQPELAVGAVAEDGKIYLNHLAAQVTGLTDDYLDTERQYQLNEIARRQKLIRGVRPAAPIANRSVIVTDDGIATGATMIAALEVIKAKEPRETIVAVPVAPPERLDAIRRRCDRLVYLFAPQEFFSIGQFYENFEQVDDEQVVALLREFSQASQSTAK